MSAPTQQRPRTGGPGRPPANKPFALANSRRRIQVVIIGFAMVLSLFAARLVELQALKGPDLAEAALNQRILSQDIPATRGEITDVDGRPLATSIEVRDITADQTLVVDPAQTAAVLGPIIGMSPTELQPLLTGDARFTYLKKATEPQVWRNIQTWRSDPGNDPVVLQGIFSERRTIRDYPNGPLASNIIGFTNAEGHGAVGLESGLDRLLAGTPGSVTFEQAAGGTEIPTSDVQQIDPVPGSDVKLTIDSDLQWAAQQAVAAEVKASGSDFGTAVVLEVGTGRILAMATAPAFDPLDPDQVKPEEWANKPVTWAMEPGSTAKLMTLAAVLNEGKMKPRSRVSVPPSLFRGGQYFKDSHEHGGLQLTLAGVLAESSNIGTVLAAEKIGGKKLYEYLKAFGVGEPTGLDLPGEQTGYVPHPKEWSDTTFPTLAFGQGMSLTAIQIANATATIGNDGVPVQPRIIDSYTAPDGTTEQTSPVEGEPVVSPETAQTMQSMMQMVVGEGGTAKVAQVPGYLVGGKTGTAQRYDEECGCYSGYTASFLAMAPADDPQLVVGAWFDHPRNGYYGGEVAAPVVQKLMTAALANHNVPPTGGKRAKWPLTWGGTS
ncbi:MAG: penicillin-binding protein 2 [Candidatus Nanopelagicales bacterium]